MAILPACSGRPPGAAGDHRRADRLMIEKSTSARGHRRSRPASGGSGLAYSPYASDYRGAPGSARERRRATGGGRGGAQVRKESTAGGPGQTAAQARGLTCRSPRQPLGPELDIVRLGKAPGNVRKVGSHGASSSRGRALRTLGRELQAKTRRRAGRRHESIKPPRAWRSGQFEAASLSGKRTRREPWAAGLQFLSQAAALGGISRDSGDGAGGFKPTSRLTPAKAVNEAGEEISCAPRGATILRRIRAGPWRGHGR